MIERSRKYWVLALLIAPCLLCLLYLGASEARVAQTAQAAQSDGLSSELSKKIDAIVEAEREKSKVPGLSIAIGLNNKLAYAKGYGSADLESNVPALPETVYRTASIAKAMTAVAVMQLADAGKIDLDAPIQKYCLAFPEKEQPITTRQLLGHLGGIRHYKTDAEANGTRHYDSVVESLTIFRNDPLFNQPGAQYTYTTFGYSILGCAIEVVSGMTYEDYMKTKVWGPAGMSKTGVDHFRLVIPNRARGYLRLSEQAFQQLPEPMRKLVKPGEIYNASLHDTSMKIPGGGIVSTASDLVRFAAAVNTGTLASEKSRSLMWTKQKTKDGKETTYGLGWVVGTSRGRLLVSHSGGQAGTSTLLSMIPEKGAIIAIMSNLQNLDLNGLIGQIGPLIVPNE